MKYKISTDGKSEQPRAKIIPELLPNRVGQGRAEEPTMQLDGLQHLKHKQQSSRDIFQFCLQALACSNTFTTLSIHLDVTITVTAL
jgi:hypothetical protein